MNVNEEDRNAHRIKNTKHKKGEQGYFGVKETEAQYKIILNLFEEHYFIEERTEYHPSIMNYLDKLQEDKTHLIGIE